MVDHRALIRGLLEEHGERAGALEREELRRVLTEHLADSEHRMALPHSWPRERVIDKLEHVFGGDPFIEHVIDVLERELAAALHDASSANV